MLILIAHVTPHADKVADFVELSQSALFAATRAEEGCISFRLLQDTEHEGSFVWLEEWESRTHLDAHLASPHFKKYFEQVGALLPRGPEIFLSEVSSQEHQQL